MDPRIDKLGNAAVLTDTQVRLSFAPQDEKANVIGITAPIRALKILQMASLMQVGRVHIQIKEGFGEERHLELSGPELMIIMDLADRLVTELPAAQRAAGRE
jgi:hypothetical protein